MVSLSTASIVKGPQAGSECLAAHGHRWFLNASMDIRRKRTKWAKLEQTGHAAFCRYSAWDYLHWRACKADSILIFHPWLPEKMEIKCRLLHFRGILLGENAWKNSFQWALPVIRFYATCTITGLLLVLKQLHAFVIALLENIDASAACFFSEHCKRLQMHKLESICDVLVY